MYGRRKVNVYVFGAGASVHVGGPLTKNFLIDGLSILCRNNDTISTDSFFKVANLIDILYGTQITDVIRKDIESNFKSLNSSIIADVTIEELLTFVELGLLNKDTWLPFREYKKALNDFIFETLDYLTSPSYSDIIIPTTDGTINHRRNCYDKLIDYLISAEDQNCFITFNYDLFLDGALSINNHGLIGDYNLNFKTVDNFPGYERLLTENRLKKDVDILKLHGSLNWAYCSKCKETHLVYHQDYVDILNKQCNTCNTPLSPILISPTLRKNIDEYGIGKLWHKAEQILKIADDITIIGYSFPDADIEAKWLFKRALAQSKRKPNLTIVEPEQIITNKLRKFFGNTVSEINIYNTKFEDWCKERVRELSTSIS